MSQPKTIGFLQIDTSSETPPESYSRLVGAVDAAQRLGYRVDVRVIHSDHTGHLAFLEFTATTRPPA